jgi:hypothetical protein
VKLRFSRGDGEEKKDGDATAALPRVVAPVGAPSVYSCGGAEERRGCDGDAAGTFARAVEPVGTPSAAVVGLYGEWRGEGRAAARNSVGSKRSSDSARFGSQTRYVRQLASRSGTGIADDVVCVYRRNLSLRDRRGRGQQLG